MPRIALGDLLGLELGLVLEIDVEGLRIPPSRSSVPASGSSQLRSVTASAVSSVETTFSGEPVLVVMREALELLVALVDEAVLVVVLVPPALRHAGD